MLAKFYQNIVLKKPGLILLILFSCLCFFGYFTKNFSFIISLLIVIIYLNYSLFLWCKKNKPVRFNLINTKEIEFLWLIKSTISCGLSLKQLLKEQAHLKNIHPSYYIFYTQLNKTGQLAHALKESGFINHTDYLILNHAEKINQLSSSLNYVIKEKIKTFSNKLDLFLSCLKPVLFLLIAALICSAFSITFYPILNLLNEFGIQ